MVILENVMVWMKEVLSKKMQIMPGSTRKTFSTAMDKAMAKGRI